MGGLQDGGSDSEMDGQIESQSAQASRSHRDAYALSCRIWMGKTCSGQSKQYPEPAERAHLCIISRNPCKYPLCFRSTARSQTPGFIFNRDDSRYFLYGCPYQYYAGGPQSHPRSSPGWFKNHDGICAGRDPLFPRSHRALRILHHDWPALPRPAQPFH